MRRLKFVAVFLPAPLPIPHSPTAHTPQPHHLFDVQCGDETAETPLRPRVVHQCYNEEFAFPVLDPDQPLKLTLVQDGAEVAQFGLKLAGLPRDAFQEILIPPSGRNAVTGEWELEADAVRMLKVLVRAQGFGRDPGPHRGSARLMRVDATGDVGPASRVFQEMVRLDALVEGLAEVVRVDISEPVCPRPRCPSALHHPLDTAGSPRAFCSIAACALSGSGSGHVGGGGGAPGPHRNTARQATDGLWTEARGQQKQSNDPGSNQHILNTPTIGRR